MKLLIFLTALSTLLANLEQKTLQADFSLTIQEKGQAAMTVPGKIVMHGEQFIGSAKGYEVAYDGTTFYFYDPDAKELTLSTPIQEELMSSNPLLFAKNLSDVSDITERVNKDGTITTITMIPKGTPDGQNQVTIKLKQDELQSIEIKETERTTTLKIKKSEYLPYTPSFVLSKPGAYTNDLR